jgi:glycosyltransferase involved in cell wall biosynthesis
MTFKLVAVWRHPFNSKKRRAFCQQRRTDMTTPRFSNSGMVHSLVALWRHPFNPQKRQAFRQQWRTDMTTPRFSNSGVMHGLVAVWRHPFNPRKRRAFRQQRRTDMTTPRFSNSGMMNSLVAAWRHPFNTRKRQAFRQQGRNGVATSGDSYSVLHSTNLFEYPFSSPDNDSIHSKLYYSYVSNAQGKYRNGEYVEEKFSPLINRPSDVKLIAYYLPQFHPIQENDEWWGKGFTEWRNVARSFPCFDDHYQPRVPGELGYYDLRVVDVMRRQVELAKKYGVNAFCFHFYWFAGKRLLELPLQNYLDNKDMDLPFCLCWANENWSRRWDGSENEVLISQEHSEADDEALIKYLDKYFRDERYLKIDGKPVFTVYRPELLPDAAATVACWRRIIKEMGYPGLYLISTNSFAFSDYRRFGFDAISEFPPHTIGVPDIQEKFGLSRFRLGGRLHSYEAIVEHELHKNGIANVHPGVMPSWDNSARRPTSGTIFHGATPKAFGGWLRHAISRAKANRPNEQMVFINAWNEWAEGAYLEPDARYGYAWLQAISDAKNSFVQLQRIVLVSHDAHHYGAQLLVLNIARTMRELGVHVDLIVLGAGPLLSQFSEVASVHLLDIKSTSPEDLRKKLQELRSEGSEAAIVNSTASGGIVPFLKDTGFRVVSLIHELPGLLAAYKLQKEASAIARCSDKVLFPASRVEQGFEAFIGNKVVNKGIRPQGLYLSSIGSKGISKADARDQLGIAHDAQVILSVGCGDRRKGLDLFVASLIPVLKRKPRALAVWLGALDLKLFRQLKLEIEGEGLADRFIFPGLKDNPLDYYHAADVFILTSREDPFPSVVLEAFAASLPVIAFADATGSESVIERDCGKLVVAFETNEMSDAVCALIDAPDEAKRLGENGRDIVDREFGFRDYVFDLLNLSGLDFPKVSVIVPNYNYANYLQERLKTICSQTIPIFEILILDDASTDTSLQVIEKFESLADIPCRVIVNEVNSGSVFRQWQRGVEEARGDFVWIAEADDLSEPEFLAEVLPAFSRPDVVMSYCESKQIDAKGYTISPDYLAYVSDVNKSRWTKFYLAEGSEEITNALFLKNTIPNVSGVVFRRQPLLSTLVQHSREITSLRFAGDWMTYVHLLQNGSVAFSPNARNLHRRHESGVTIGNFNREHLDEIIYMQQKIIETFELGHEEKKRAAEYIRKLEVQFGLQSSDVVEG